MDKEIIDITPPTDEEIFLAAIQKYVAQTEKGLYVFNDKRYKELQRAYNLLRKLLLEYDPEAEIEIEPSPINKKNWQIQFKTTEITVMTDEMPVWTEITNLADNFCCDPTTRGKRLRGGFVFLDVMTKRR